jgi:eukaryotic-like serine/threonine-protein kinase
MNLCDRLTAERLINDSLSLEETNQFEEHLASCPTCQALLVEVAGGPATLDNAAAFLSSSIEVPQWTEKHHSTISTRTDELSRSNHAVDLSVLGPTDDPESMGRIGNYEIQGIIGRGGMGIVFRAVDSALSRNVALKVLDPSLASVAAARKRFAMEARAMAAISHEHVVPVYTVDEHRGLPYFAMEYVPGGTLESRIRKQGPLDVLSVLRISRQIALALSAAHECGLVHRDIKPANILLDRGIERVRVADFGLARVNSDASHTRSGFIAGTPQFMAPEQVRGETCTSQSDLFSLGTVMYAMCTGHSPFRSESMYGSMQRIVHEEPRSICEQVPLSPDWLERFIFKLLSKKAGARFSDATSVATLLESEIAYAENPSQNKKPLRLEYSPPIDATFIYWKASMALISSVVAIICLAIWMTPPVTETHETATHAPTGEASKIIEWTIEEPITVDEATIRNRARMLEQSYQGSDPLPVIAPFENDLRRLKKSLDAFEKQVP